MSKIEEMHLKQQNLEKIIKSQAEVINMLQQENLVIKSKFESMEFLLFSNPQLHGSPGSEEF
jgi:hypothetical protein